MSKVAVEDGYSQDELLSALSAELNEPQVKLLDQIGVIKRRVLKDGDDVKELRVALEIAISTAETIKPELTSEVVLLWYLA
ncbi:hypothetical protein, partial [Phyllobacterium sp. P5_D12]